PGARRADALVAVAETFLAHGVTQAPVADRHQVVVHVDAVTLADAADGDRCHVQDGPGLAAATVRRLTCDSSLVASIHDPQGRPLDVARKTRAIPPALRRALSSRDGGCRFPGCTTRRRVDGHHIRHWADGGPTSLDNLVLLCRFHHRLVHEGGYRLRRSADTLTFARPDGQPLPTTPPVTQGDLDHLVELHTLLDLDITASTIEPHWQGEHLDLDAVLTSLQPVA
ncbi:MAG: HNH endonuclease, partial [Actinomycetota bacterium]|nr:HNH endonuclease [Actinomycetota bacterium]